MDAELRVLPEPLWRRTDDTNMAASVLAVLAESGRIVQDALPARFANTYDAHRVYGANMHDVLAALGAGKHWSVVARRQFGGAGSYGKGAAMRVAPIGAYFAEDLTRVVAEAIRSADITHAHSEAVAGAVAGGAATAAWSRGAAAPEPRAFLEEVMAWTPESEVRRGLHRAHRLGPRGLVQAIAFELGSGARVSAQDSLPYVLWAASRRLDDFETAVWDAIQGGGDVDTTSAMVGAIVAARLGRTAVPTVWIERREALPDFLQTPLNHDTRRLRRSQNARRECVLLAPMDRAQRRIGRRRALPRSTPERRGSACTTTLPSAAVWSAGLQHGALGWKPGRFGRRGGEALDRSTVRSRGGC